MKNKLSSGYIYIYIERERERERVIQHHHQQRSKLRSGCQIGKLSSEIIKKGVISKLMIVSKRQCQDMGCFAIELEL